MKPIEAPPLSPAAERPAEGKPSAPAPPAGKAGSASPSQRGAAPAVEGSRPAGGPSVDMLCPMCDAIVAVPVERPVRVSCPKCREEYYFTR